MAENTTNLATTGTRSVSTIAATTVELAEVMGG